jgi:hypothetical protein
MYIRVMRFVSAVSCRIGRVVCLPVKLKPETRASFCMDEFTF